jgi:hypothetical protein
MGKNNYIDNKRMYAEFVEWKKLCLRAKKDKKSAPKIPDYIGECFLLLANNISHKPNFFNYCVDGKTEALTQRGWLKYNEITVDDIILSYDIETKMLVWSKIKEIFINNKYNGMMHKLDIQGMDALVTPQHKFVSVEDGLKTVEQLKAKEHIVLTGLPVRDGVENIANDFIELVGWAVTKGSFKRGKNTHAINISQSHEVNIKFEKRIRKILVDLECCFSEGKNKEGMTWFNLTGEYANLIHDIAPNRVLSMKFILSLSQQQRLLLIDTMINGDGWNTYHYTQKDKNHIDSFVALCTIAGLKTGTHYIENQTKFGVFKGYVVNIFKRKNLSCFGDNIDFHGGRSGWGGYNRNKKEHQNIPTIKYKGVVWCPKTEYGTWICRRGNYVYVTGNTYKDEMISDGIENCILYAHNFNPKKSKNPFAYFTQIIYFAFIRRIGKEKKQLYIKRKMVENSMFDDSLVNHDEGSGDGGVPSYIDLNNEKMNTMVKDYEKSLKDKKEKIKLAKKKKKKFFGLDKFIDEDKE